MSRLKNHIETIMISQDKDHFPVLKKGLYALSLIYGGAVALRSYSFRENWLSVKRLPCTVISVGNITVGGTGKTPLTIYLAQKIRSLGYSVAVVSRGYKGSAEKTGGIVSDGETVFMEPENAGDEPFMMAARLEGVPIIVGRDRYAGGMLAITRYHSTVIILDDGFQHLKIERDLNLLLIDSRHPLGNGYLLPRGTLRESADAIKRADGIIVTRSGDGSETESRNDPLTLSPVKPYTGGKPVFRSSYIHTLHPVNLSGRNPSRTMSSNASLPFGIDSINDLKEQTVYAFSGIARNDDFKKTVEALGCFLTGFKPFPDHHPYRTGDLDRIAGEVRKSRARMILTTEKDAVRIPENFSWPVPVAVIALDVTFRPDSESFDTFIKNRLQNLNTKKSVDT